MRGDVYEMPHLADTRGHEQAGRRYAVVVQSDLVPMSTCLVSPTSTKAAPKDYRPEIEIGDETTKVLVEQTRAISVERLGRMVARVSHDELTQIDEALRIVLDVDDAM